MIRCGWINTLARAGLVMALLGCWQTAPGRAAHQNAPAQTGMALLQFTSGGHGLGFAPHGVYLVKGDHVLRESFIEAAPSKPVADGAGEIDHGQAPALERVQYTDLWPGIDLVYDAPTGGILRSTYTLAPGADPHQIRLGYNVPVHLEADGSLTFAFERGHMSASAPLAWQEMNGERLPVDIRFQVEQAAPTGLVSFQLGGYDPAYPLTIDPTITWTAFLGGSGIDTVHAIAIDSDNHIYVAGSSRTTWGSPIRAYSGDMDAFVARLDSDGTLVWNTFLGSAAANDNGNAIAVDAAGNIYVAGESARSWGSPVEAFAGGRYDAFAARLDSDGTLIWNTFLGGIYTGMPNPLMTATDYGNGIAVDHSSNVYVIGQSDFTWGSPLIGYSGGRDAFVAKLDGDGIRQWNTFLGSSAFDSGDDITVDSSGDIYVAGSSSATWGSPVDAHAGADDAFIAKLDGDGDRQWNTFLGGTGDEAGTTLALDGSGNIYLAGSSTAEWGIPVDTFAGSADAFAAKLNSSGVRAWNTFLGGSNADVSLAIALDAAGNIYMAGQSYASWGAPINPFTSNGEAFVAKLGRNGVTQWNTFIGSQDWESAAGLTLDRSGRIYVVGYSVFNGSSPLNPDYYSEDAFVVQFSDFPVLEAEGNGHYISSGDTSPDSADDTDFGATAVAGGSVMHLFTLKNTGIDPLNLSGSPRIGVSGPAAADFKVLDNPFSPLDPGAQTDFMIQFDPSASGLREATVSIVYNAPASPYTFAIQGEGTATPEIDVLGKGQSIPSGDTTPSTLDGTDFSGLPLTGSLTQTFTIRNTGVDDLTLDGATPVTISGAAAADFSITAPPVSPVPPGSSTTFTVSFAPSVDGLRQATLSIANNDPDENPYTFALQGTGANAPEVVFGGNTFPAPNTSLSFGPSYVTVEFNTRVKGAADAYSANSPGNYLLFSDGGNGFQTVDCAGGVASSDVRLPIGQVFYDDHDGAGPFMAIITVNNATPLPAGHYRFLICGTTSIQNLAGAELNGGADAALDFTVAASSSGEASGDAGTISMLPATGFAPGVVSGLPPQPAQAAYQATAMRLTIPSLDLDQPIAGIPSTTTGWDITWLGNQIGYLQGTAFPTWAGNSVLTGHVADANGNPGPFAGLGTLTWGDPVVIRAWGQEYTYAVRTVDLLSDPNDTSILSQHETLPWLTLITCRGYDEETHTYRWRTIVRAVLVHIQ
ncbi:MAG: choice-of-anchor D domain-containing protein [Chloroflexi bacterium]|nr:choice-of-anchor D domain-containing protein [Chloroflexota bacterium]